MFNSSMTRRAGIFAGLLLAGVLVAGCNTAGVSSTGQRGAGMMGDSPGLTSLPGGAGMMAAGPGYSYSRLSCSAPTALPGAKVNVMLADMGMTQMMGGIAPMGSRMMLQAGPATVAAGQISVVASNVGWRTHELVILPLTAGATAGQRISGADGKVAEAGSLGEASGDCVGGAGEGIPAGGVGWVTVTLAPGRYELVCNLQNHYADGMHQELTVA